MSAYHSVEYNEVVGYMTPTTLFDMAMELFLASQLIYKQNPVSSAQLYEVPHGQYLRLRWKNFPLLNRELDRSVG